MSDRFGLMEATKRYAKKSLTSKVEKDLERDMGKAFVEQGLVMAKGFARLSYLFSESAVDKSLDPLFDAAEAATFGVMEGGMNDASVKALALGHQALAAEMGMQLSFDVANPYAAAYLQAHGAAMVTNINETTRTAIQSLVTQGVEEGWSYTKTAEELIHKYKEFAIGKPQEHIDGRAHLIAITETGNAYMEGQFALMDTMAGMGLPMEKAWSTMGDDRVSDECEENESAGWIAFDEPFPSGDMHPLRFPGCRCDMEERMEEGTELPAEGEGAPYEFPYSPDADLLQEVDGKMVDGAENIISHGKLGYGDMTPDELLQMGVNNVQTLVDENPISIRSTPGSVADILDSGRFKSQFETKSSNGTYDPWFRAKAEANGMGVPMDISDELRPIYGFVSNSDTTANYYGKVEWVLKEEIKNRSTVTVGDSLAAFHNSNVAATPAKAVTRVGLDGNIWEAAEKNWEVIRYVETQIHGGVTVADVKTVIFHGSVSGMQGDISRLEALGIKVIVK